MGLTVLDRATWQARQAAHEARVDEWVQPHLGRRKRGEKHPVLDFLFTYYSYRPAHLRRWHPGAFVVLEGPSDLGQDACLDVPAIVHKRCSSLEWIRDLLVATASRPPHLGCFGMHEWAMVYRQTQEEVRHNAWPLRLSARDGALLVEERGVRCSHFDAFRFFTAPARPLNVLQPTRESQHDLEQPGCLHANMDVYKWAYKLSPLVPSELVADCFVLARDIRTLDMRASPYDLADLGYPPVQIETPAGRAEYTASQKALAARAEPLRATLIEAVTRVLDDARAGVAGGGAT